jgi:hypothetical protein
METSIARVVVHRPGQVVALDTTPLPVKVRESVFGEPMSVHLTLALDVYTHSIVAFRLTLVSDASVDVAMLLRDVMMPPPLREAGARRWSGPIRVSRQRWWRSSPTTRSQGSRSSPRDGYHRPRVGLKNHALEHCSTTYKPPLALLI